MLDELSPHMPAAKRKALVSCLNDKRIEQALGTEAELALAWAFRQTHDAVVEPPLPDSARGPDLMAKKFAGTDAWIEISAVSDANYAGDKRMRGIVQQYVNAGGATAKYLSFEFNEEMGFNASGFYRRVLAPEGFKLDEAMLAEFRTWLTDTTAPLLVQRPGLRLAIARRTYALKDPDYRGRTVPTIHHLEDNPIYGRLEEKRRRRQLPIGKGAGLCGIILWDAGCWAMRNAFSASPHSVSLAQIVHHFIGQSNIDFVSVLTQLRRGSVGFDHPSIVWRAHTFTAGDDERRAAIEREIGRVLAVLPHPRFEGYQVRSLQDRKLFAPRARGWYLAPRIISHGGHMVMKISARALQEAMATGDFRGIASRYAGGPDGKNAFASHLFQGRVIKSCSLEAGGLDEDDDYIVIELGADPAASTFV